MDAKPFIEQGRTFVPIRYLAYGLGVAEEGINWEGQTSTVTLKKGGTEVELAIGSQEIIINGIARAMVVAPILREGLITATKK